MPSFSFPNMLPNMMAANMMGLGLGGMNILQQQHLQHRQCLSPQPTRPLAIRSLENHPLAWQHG